MPVDENNLSIGSLSGSKEERKSLARKSVDFCCDTCGPVSAIIKERIPKLIPGVKPINKEELIFNFAPEKKVIIDSHIDTNLLL